MTKPMARTMKFLVLITLLFGGACLGWELTASPTGHDLISPTIQWLWSQQPWVILLVVALAVFLLGHFVAQNKGEYDDLRRREDEESER